MELLNYQSIFFERGHTTVNSCCFPDWRKSKENVFKIALTSIFSVACIFRLLSKELKHAMHLMLAQKPLYASQIKHERTNCAQFFE